MDWTLHWVRDAPKDFVVITEKKWNIGIELFQWLYWCLIVEVDVYYITFKGRKCDVVILLKLVQLGNKLLGNTQQNV